jgi:hypothetical protein
VSEQGVDLQSVARAQDGSLQHLLIRSELLQGGLHGLFRNAQPLPDFNGSRPVAETDNGNVHGAGLRMTNVNDPA